MLLLGLLSIHYANDVVARKPSFGALNISALHSVGLTKGPSLDIAKHTLTVPRR